MNRSSRKCAQTSAMDETFLERLHIDTPTPENVGNTSGNVIFFDFVFLCIYVYVIYIYIYIYIYINVLYIVF